MTKTLRHIHDGFFYLVKEGVVVLAEDVPVLHEPEVLLPDRPLYGGGHPAAEDPPLLT